MRPPRRRLALAGALAAAGVGALAAVKLRGGLVRALDPLPGERILGAGVGAGVFAAVVAEKLWPGGELVLVDVPEAAADEAHARGLESVTVVDDARFDDRSFDGAFVVGVTDLAELGRVLRPGARVVAGDRHLRAELEAAGFAHERGNRFRHHG